MAGIKKKILILLAFLGLFGVAGAVLGLVINNVLVSRTLELTEEYIPAKMELASLEVKLLEAFLNERQMIVTEAGSNKYIAHKNNYLKYTGDIERLLPKLRIKSLDKDAVHLANNLAGSFSVWAGTTHKMLMFAGSAPIALAIDADESKHNFDETMSDFQRLQQYMQSLSDEATAAEFQVLKIGNILLLIAVGCSIVISLYAFRYAHVYLSNILSKLDSDIRYDNFSTELNEALEMADTEKDVYKAAARALDKVTQTRPCELLIMDVDDVGMQRVVEHPELGHPSCEVTSPYQCVAIRRGKTVEFKNNEDLNTCPKLVNRGDSPLSAVCVPITFMGRNMGVLHTTAPVDIPDNPVEISQLNILGSQIGARIGTVRAFEKTQSEAMSDSLTGLHNRRSMELSTEHCKQPYCLIMVDIDHFKLLNDCHGHEVGDRALVFFADLLRRHLDEADIPARWGGEEFAIQLPDTTVEEGAEKAEHLRLALEREVTESDIPDYTASFGVAESQFASQTMTDVLRMADSALYKAKEQGRNCVVIANDDGSMTTVGGDDDAEQEASKQALGALADQANEVAKSRKSSQQRGPAPYQAGYHPRGRRTG